MQTVQFYLHNLLKQKKTNLNLKTVSATPRYYIAIYQLPGTSWHLSSITKAWSTLKPHLYLYLFNQGGLLDAE